MTEPGPEQRASISLSLDEVDLLRMGLVRYIAYCQEHYEEDGGKSHTEEELDRARTEAGRLLWRLEEEAAPPGVHLVHSEWSVPPESAE